mmetsp:Transcript_38457/g.105955  ORF Transcript_38457/g.105955 Transcript_38457/m.105955 type:complete len:178 (+) Transcript_38457:65-598(+)
MFNSMADIRRKQDEEKEARKREKEEKKQGAEFYTGGAKSGMAVEGPDDDASEGSTPSSAAETPAQSATFAGQGMTLGGGSSSGTSAAAPVQAQAGSIEVDASKPKTRVQIRFHDGQRRAQEFNEGHTVGDLRTFCSQCVGGQPMVIMGGFPPKEVSDDALTLKDAGLCSAAITVKPK